MKLLICAATQQELKTIKASIKALHLKISLPLEYFCTWIGNHWTIYNLTTFLCEHRDEEFFIVNIGVCGYYFPLSERTSFVWEKIIQWAVLEHLSLKKETIVPISLSFAPLKKIISSEIPIDDEMMISHWKDEEIYVDMESYGIELVAQQFRYPRLILKVPIDRVWEETKQFNIKEALEQLSENIDYKKLIEHILKYIEDIKK